jgi:hypothetical protein
MTYYKKPDPDFEQFTWVQLDDCNGKRIPGRIVERELIEVGDCCLRTRYTVEVVSVDRLAVIDADTRSKAWLKENFPWLVSDE